MAGVTDASYRRLIKRIAPEVIVYTEFLSTDAIHYGARKTMELLDFDPALERPFIVQVFGKDPEHFLSAAKVIEELGADGIDINMGCPAAKVVSSCHGSALIRDPRLAAELVHATVKTVSIPVSVKTRLGWETTDTLIPFCKGLIDAGASALAIHGRRYHDKFSGRANWDPIYELKREVRVPVIGNGDIASAEDAVRMIGNLDGVMVGRGTFGNPWVMADIMEALRPVPGTFLPHGATLKLSRRKSRGYWNTASWPCASKGRRGECWRCGDTSRVTSKEWMEPGKCASALCAWKKSMMFARCSAP